VSPRPTPLIRDSGQALERAQREFERGHVKETADLLEQALALGAEGAGVRTLLGICYARMQAVDRAFDHLERAVDLDPQGFSPRCALGELYLRLCIPEKGREHLARARELATRPDERNYVERLLSEERARDRRRIKRPSFPEPFWRPRRWDKGS
jgi:tetratricopeptide (TPR) repeat protein